MHLDLLFLFGSISLRLFASTLSDLGRQVKFRFRLILIDALDWSIDMVVPTDIKVLYFAQCGFYVHSIYATIYMDSKRKDFYAMMLHHVLTIALISLSYVSRSVFESPETSNVFAFRYHKIGLLVLFMHDVTDIFMEITKLMRYLTVRKGGRVSPFWDYASQAGFATFTVSWFLFRLYWFPLKVLYSAGVALVYRLSEKDSCRYTLFNILLWILLILNLYWLFVSVCQGDKLIDFVLLRFSLFSKFSIVFYCDRRQPVETCAMATTRRRTRQIRKFFLLLISEYPSFPVI